MIFLSKLFLTLLLFHSVGIGMNSQEKKQKNELNFFHKSAIAFAMAPIDAVSTTWLQYFKNRIQAGQPIEKNPKIWWRGTGSNALFLAPITICQVTVADALGGDDSQSSAQQKIGAGLASGALSGVICAPLDLIVRHQQNVVDKNESNKKKTGTFSTAKRLQSQYGKGVFARAMGVTMGREALFSAGYNALIPWCKQEALKYTDNKLLAEFLANGGVGIAVATTSHSLDLLQSKVQEDPGAQKYKNAWDATKQVYNTKGIKGLHVGLVPRIALATVSLTVLAKAKETFTKKTEKWINR